MKQALEEPQNGLPQLAIESVARGFFREAEKYGFDQVDLVRFVSCLLDLSMSSSLDHVPSRPAIAQQATATSSDLPLRCDKVMIRAFEAASDAPVLTHWLEDELGGLFLLASTLTRRLTLESMIEDPANVVGMITLPDGTPIGVTAFLNVDHEQHKAELRKLIGEPGMRRRGYAKAASAMWLEYGFSRLGLHKIYLNTLDTNLRNIRLNESLGFRLEGILHDEVCINGRFHDVLRMATWRP